MLSFWSGYVPGLRVKGIVDPNIAAALSQLIPASAPGGADGAAATEREPLGDPPEGGGRLEISTTPLPRDMQLLDPQPASVAAAGGSAGGQGQPRKRAKSVEAEFAKEVSGRYGAQFVSCPA
mmetsp:Transcript_47455/g.133510  ORF Transcript_47455/g.133510 Transcript_47455/m.133510 type:complete len:122 (-) Transcript_47455:411-776(-)